MVAYIALTLLFGAVVTLHVAMNARLGALVGSPVLANAVFWGVGFAASLAIAASRLGQLPWPGLARVHPGLFAAGLLGSVLALFNTWIIPKVGISVFSLVIILGQLLASCALARYGLLGVPLESPSPLRLGGLALAVTGAIVFLAAK